MIEKHIQPRRIGMIEKHIQPCRIGMIAKHIQPRRIGMIEKHIQSRRIIYVHVPCQKPIIEWLAYVAFNHNIFFVYCWCMDLSFLFRIVTNFVIQGFLIYEFCSCLKAVKFPVIVASFSFVRLFCMNCCNDNHIKSLHLILLSCMSYFLSCFDYTCILLVLKLCFGFSYMFTLNITEKTYKLSKYASVVVLLLVINDNKY